MIKKLLPLALACMFIQINLEAQTVRFGIYAGVGFCTEKSDYSEISTLPISEGGLNLHAGLHVNMRVMKRLEVETGLQKVTRGYTYTPNDIFAVAQYTKIQCASVPVMAVYHLLNYPEEVPFRVSIGLGAYGSYAISGKIRDENGNTQNAKFSNAKRIEFGPRWMVKWEFFHRLEAYLSNDIRSTNVLKNGNGYLKQGSFQVGLGYVF